MAETTIQGVECKETRNEGIVHLVDDNSWDGCVGCRSSSRKLFRLLMRKGIATGVMEKFLIMQALSYDGVYM